MRFCGFIWSLTMICAKFSYGQNPPQQEIDIQSFVEQYFTTQDAHANYQDLYETLFTLYSNPLDINLSTTEQLRSLNILSEIQIKSLSDHIQSSDKLLSLYELQSVDGFNQATIDKLLPFIKIGGLNTIDNRSLWQRIRGEDNNYLLVRYERILQTKRGFKAENASTPAKYRGDQGKYYMRFRTSHTNDFSIGFTMEKDAGEEFIWEPSTHRYGSDFYSFHLQVQQKGIVKNLIIGDYQLQIGQGLLSGAGFSMGKGAETINTVRRNHLGLRPYTSPTESGFFRGISSVLQYKTLDFTAFFSQLKRDALLYSDTNEHEVFITALQSSGFHRTASEIDAKGTIHETVLGGNITRLSKDENLRVSITAIFTRYSTPLLITPQYYNQFDFSGDHNLVLGASGSRQWRNLNIFGEVGMSQSGAIGAVGGFLSSLTSKLDFALSIRHYPVDFHSFYGKSFGENTINKNENGSYWGFKYKYNRKLTLSAYYDKFAFPWLRSRVKSPSDGYEYLFKLQFKTSKTVSMYLQYREKEKSKSVENKTNQIDVLKAGVKRNFIINTDYKSNKMLSLKTRFQMSSYHIGNATTQGVAIIQDAALKIGRFTLSGRYALFQTDDYENRQYVYEKDVRYAFSIPAYSGLGSRNYLILQYRHNRHWRFWLRYAVTDYRDRKKISSGLEEIDGNIKSTLKLQLQIRL